MMWITLSLSIIASAIIIYLSANDFSACSRSSTRRADLTVSKLRPDAWHARYAIPPFAVNAWFDDRGREINGYKYRYIKAKILGG